MLSRSPLLPNQVLPSYSSLDKPYRHQIDPSSAIDESTMEQLPFLSTISLHPSTPKKYTPGNAEPTPHAYQVLSALQALPNQEKNKQKCMDCLREKNGADCTRVDEEGVDSSHSCFRDWSVVVFVLLLIVPLVCRVAQEVAPFFSSTCHSPNYCGRLCEVSVAEKPVSKVVVVKAPKFKKDPERLIPRIIHQVSEQISGTHHVRCTITFFHLSYSRISSADLVRASHTGKISQHGALD
jgi:hypothetical protein